LTGTLTLPVPEGYGELLLAATYAYSSRYSVSAPSNTPFGVMPSTRLLNLNLNWNAIGGSPVDAGLFVTNLTDQKYWTFVPGVFDALGMEARSLGQPRMYGGRIRVNFGK
jgi:iron complex outermembrane receptor protein